MTGSLKVPGSSTLSDVVIEAHSLEGFPDPIWHMEQVKRIIGDDVVGMTPTVHVPAMLSFQYGGQWVTRPVQLIGIDEKTQASAGDFAKFLQHPANRDQQMKIDSTFNVEDFRKALAKVDAAGTRIDRLGADVQASLTADTLPRVNQLMQDLQANSQQINRVLDEIERAPQSLILGKTPRQPGPGEVIPGAKP